MSSSPLPIPVRILVADDEPDAAEVLAMLLAEMGHETAVAHDGRQAIELATSFVPTIAILDLDMPVMDGLAAAKLLADRAPGCARPYLIALTANAATDLPAQVRAAGLDLYLSKPADVEALLLVVELVTQPRSG